MDARIENIKLVETHDSRESTLSEKPEVELNILNALDQIQESVRNSKLSKEFWDECGMSIDYLCSRLRLNRNQVVLISIMSEIGDAVSWRHIGDFIGLSRLRTMSFTPDIEDLRDRRWIYQCAARERGVLFDGFKLVYGVINAFRHNREFEPEKIEGLSEQVFVDRLTRYVSNEGKDCNIPYEENHRWILQLAEANRQLPLCRTVMALHSKSAQVLLLLAVADYARYAEEETEGLTLSEINSWFDNGEELESMSYELQSGGHELMVKGIIEHECMNGMVDTNRYLLTGKAKEELLMEYRPHLKKVGNIQISDRDICKSTDIKEKTLFYNDEERSQLERLKTLLSKQELKKVQTRLSECGLRQGITCLFYGAPGTGKTESVLQLARETGRDIMQVEIAGLRDKWVGESEKNIKWVFRHYRELCKSSEKMPILFFNEADAIINRRMETTRSSVERMDNAMQNIILQEIENLDGILIATTNLTCGLDRAFDRRFLFKVEFTKPNIEARRLIWHAMLPEMSEDECRELARDYDFSGGQIENVARKCKIEHVVSGERPTLSSALEFCKEEYLNRSRGARIGF